MILRIKSMMILDWFQVIMTIFQDSSVLQCMYLYVFVLDYFGQFNMWGDNNYTHVQGIYTYICVGNVFVVVEES